MNKKVNTLLFILGATLFNILVTLLSFILLSVLFVTFLMPILPEAAVNVAFSLFFIAAIAIAFIVYRVVLNKITNKIKFEDYFDPILRGRRPPPKRKSD